MKSFLDYSLSDRKGIIFNPIPADQSSGENNRSKMAGKSRPKPLNVYLYIPNIIGYLRILMNCVAFAVCFVDKKLFSLLYFVSFVCDALDGWFARKFNQAEDDQDLMSTIVAKSLKLAPFDFYSQHAFIDQARPGKNNGV
ncbi:hypothetical protein H5410_039652 [Solanum commersonii]|uniref:CDP-diacylglycerol--inositol 3-phosphatidyltransferase n=1 Tax=Solanum commersonii TaxID=4109 RepID=A0A9J5XMV4_SOLCO|nr:hypothetical protein H5410_039652 [Solanum commersonii]